MEAVAWDLARAFAKRGLEVSVLTTACSKLAPHAVLEGVSIECLPTRQARYSRKWWRQSAEAIRSRYWGKVDVIMSVSIGAFGAVSLISGGVRPLFVSQVHGTAWGEFRSKFRNPSILSWLKAAKNLVGLPGELKFRQIDAQIAIGEKVSRELQLQPTKFIRGGCKTFLISNGIDESVFSFSASARETIRSQLGIVPHERVVISTCRLHPQKGVSLALQAFSIAAREEPLLRMIVLGDGPESEALKHQVVDLGLASRVYFAGAVQRDEMKGYLSAADMLLFTTLRVEGLPLNLLEALSAGLPCLISNHIDDPQFETIAVNPRDPGSVAKELLSVARLSQSPRTSRLPRSFTLDHAVDQYLKIFSDLKGAAP
jgi:glycosyltransferase involved in cell wall biosynthesis